MFRKFVDQTNTSLTTNAVNNVVREANDSTSSTHQDDTIPPVLLEVNNAMTPDSPVLRNISSLMDMIHTLQEQVNKLTAEVNRLVVQASAPFSRFNSDNHIRLTDRNPNIINAGNINSHSVNEASTHDYSVRIDENEQGSPIAADKIRRTSTPMPKPRSHPSETEILKQTQPKPKPRKTLQSTAIPKKILLMGDSIITGINTKGLKDKVYKHGISGATVDSLLQEIDVYDLRNFSHAILYVGGNNASNRTEIEYFEEKYDQLISYIKEKNKECKILLVNCCPRGDTDISPINDAICHLADEHKIEIVDAHKAFFNKKGELIQKYYCADKIHFSDSGVKRLVGTISNHLDIVDNYSNCVFGATKRTNGWYKQVTQPRQSRPTTQEWRTNGAKPPCSKCGEFNHRTRDCNHVTQLKCHNCGYYGHKSRRCQPH